MTRREHRRRERRLSHHPRLPITTAPSDWQSWQTSWDRRQEWYMPDREERFRVMIDTVEAVTGPTPRVLDLACGTGSITDRLLRRLPGAHSTCVDIDPALLTIARGHFAGDERVTFAEADVTRPTWTEHLPHASYDAVVTAQRFALLGDPRQPKPDGGARRDRPTATRWHLETLRGQGFSEARQVWCSAGDALVAALR
ncbi:class I SAM-dependent methyltransferase [Streptomyces sp. NPDC003442]